MTRYEDSFLQEIEGAYGHELADWIPGRLLAGDAFDDVLGSVKSAIESEETAA